MSEATSVLAKNAASCPHCGSIHTTTCPRVSAIEYHPDGTLKRVEFHSPQPFNLSQMLVGKQISTTAGASDEDQ